MNILLLEDNPEDIELMRRELRKAGGDLAVRVARNKEEFLEALDLFGPDLLLSDYTLPDFNVMGALTLARERFPELPVIVVSGDIGEETAIETLKAGATDYVLKQRLARLGPVVRRALDEAELSAGKKRAEAALHESDQRLRSLFENSLDAIFMIAPDGRVFDVNPAACAMFGRTKEEFIGIGRKEVPAADPEALAGVLADVARAGKIRRELAYRRKDGTTIQLDLTSATVRGPEGPLSLVFLHDITERKLAEQVLKRDKETLELLVKESSRRLLAAQAELELTKRISDIGTLAANVANELRTPLAAISLAAANISRKAANPLLERNLASIAAKVSESSQVISNLLFFSRLKPPRYEKVRLAEVLRQAVKAAGCALKKNARITTNLDSFRAVIEADPTQLKEAFLNILANACDALPDTGGEIRVLAAENAGAVTVRIENYGPAVAPELLARVFEPFFTTKGKGMGLGLYVCRQIIQFHKGAIAVESGPGGTAFTVTLPGGQND